MKTFVLVPLIDSRLGIAEAFPRTRDGRGGLNVSECRAPVSVGCLARSQNRVGLRNDLLDLRDRSATASTDFRNERCLLTDCLPHDHTFNPVTGFDAHIIGSISLSATLVCSRIFVISDRVRLRPGMANICYRTVKLG